MKTWHYAFIWAACAAVIGCRTDPNIPLLERELRRQEDEIYKLQDALGEHRGALEGCRRENVALREKLGTPGGPVAPGSAAPSLLGPMNPRRGESPPPAGAIMQPPAIELPGEGTFKTPDTLQVPGAKPAPDEAPAFKPAPSLSPPGKPAAAVVTPPKPVAKVDSKHVEKIQLNPILTGPYDPDGQPWDKGLAVLVEPRDTQGRLVSSAAPMSVVVLDPSMEGESARVARWDFSAEDVATMFLTTPVAQGIYLPLPWPAGPPKHKQLAVYVRLTTSDGRKLESNREIAVDLASNPPRKPLGLTPARLGEPELNDPGLAARSGQWQPAPPTGTPVQPPSPAAEELPAPPPVEAKAKAEPKAEPKSTAKRSEPTVERPVWTPYR